VKAVATGAQATAAKSERILAVAFIGASLLVRRLFSVSLQSIDNISKYTIPPR
jgi:hypothetical protein